VLLSEIRIGGIAIEERSLTVEDLYAADEVFITSTTRDLMPVHEIEGRRLNGTGDVRARLAAAFGEFVAQDIAARKPVHA
jgi:branched-chain amino acid aminotransferase